MTRMNVNTLVVLWSTIIRDKVFYLHKRLPFISGGPSTSSQSAQSSSSQRPIGKSKSMCSNVSRPMSTDMNDIATQQHVEFHVGLHRSRLVSTKFCQYYTYISVSDFWGRENISRIFLFFFSFSGYMVRYCTVCSTVQVWKGVSTYCWEATGTVA